MVDKLVVGGLTRKPRDTYIFWPRTLAAQVGDRSSETGRTTSATRILNPSWTWYPLSAPFLVLHLVSPPYRFHLIGPPLLAPSLDSLPRIPNRLPYWSLHRLPVLVSLQDPPYSPSSPYWSCHTHGHIGKTSSEFGSEACSPLTVSPCWRLLPDPPFPDQIPGLFPCSPFWTLTPPYWPLLTGSCCWYSSSFLNPKCEFQPMSTATLSSLRTYVEYLHSNHPFRVSPPGAFSCSPYWTSPHRLTPPPPPS